MAIIMQYMFMFIDSVYITFYSVLETSTLSHVVCNSLMLFNKASVLNVLPGEFPLKFQFWIFQASHVRTPMKRSSKMWTKAFNIIGSSFLMSILAHYWQIWLFIVTLYYPWSTDSLKIVFLDLVFMFYYGQRITQVCF